MHPDSRCCITILLLITEDLLVLGSKLKTVQLRGCLQEIVSIYFVATAVLLVRLAIFFCTIELNSAKELLLLIDPQFALSQGVGEVK